MYTCNFIYILWNVYIIITVSQKLSILIGTQITCACTCNDVPVMWIIIALSYSPTLSLNTLYRISPHGADITSISGMADMGFTLDNVAMLKRGQ